MVSQIDIFPTLCDLLAIEAPAWLQGRSLLPLVHDEVEQLHEAIYAETTYHAAYEPQRCVRTDRWKYIRRFEQRATPVLPNGDDAPSKDVLLHYGLANRQPSQEALYDLIFDPQEANNLATDPAYTDTLAAMRQRLTAWMRQTRDPLLDGPIPAPFGATLNDPDQSSPNDPTHQI
jgi:arylsulfatase A-like enzyme